MTADKKLRVGLVGAGGGISRLRGNAVKAYPRAEVTMCCEADTARTDRVKERYPDAPVAAMPDELFASPTVDVVIISTPNTSHFELAEKALLAGKHVCVEYPLVQTVAQYDRLAALARERGVVLHEGLTSRLENFHLAVKDCLPRIGQPLSGYAAYFLGKTGWYWREELAGNIFVILTIHQLDHFRDLFGPVREVYAQLRETPVTGGKVSATQASFRFACGVPVVIENGWGLPKLPGLVYRVVGSEGKVEFVEEQGHYYRHLDVPGAARETREIALDFQKTLADDTGQFFAEILDGMPPCVTLKEGREALRLCLLAKESASTGRSVTA